MQLPAALTVAVLDDDPAVRRIVSRFLQHAGATVLAPEPTPEVAADLLEGRLAPDLLLLDRQLGTLDGYRLWCDLRERQPALADRTALLTGGLPPEGAPPGLVTLQKPTTREDLLAWAVRSYGAGRSTSESR